MWVGGPINGTFFRWANKWYTYPITYIPESEDRREKEGKIGESQPFQEFNIIRSE
jgi:hypothetical protein